jgi:trimethylamine--corrinoid protein Co-methyltransferase
MKAFPAWRPSLTMMNQDKIEQLHTAAIQILVDIGLNVHHPDMRTRLGQAGAKLGGEAHVFLTAEMVSGALKTAQRDVVIHNRLGEPVMPLGANQIYFGTGSDLIYTHDTKSEEHRLSLVIMTSFSGLDAFERIHEMACLIAGGDTAFRKHPNYIMYGQFISPLEHDLQAIERLIFCADRGIPLIYVPTIMSGASGPLTMYGTMALALAETLAGLVMHQLQQPGAPFITGACVSPLDMKTGLFPYGSPEWRLNDLIMAEMSRHYGIPVFGTGGATDSKLVDAQTGAEYASSLLVAALSGTNLIHDVGYLNSGLTGSLESIVLGADQIRWIKRFVSGFEVSEESLAADVLAEVGPAGDFLSHDHTFRHLKSVWLPHAIDHKDYDTWKNDGADDYAARARQYAQKIIASHQVEAIDGCLDEKLKSYTTS